MRFSPEYSEVKSAHSPPAARLWENPRDKPGLDLTQWHRLDTDHAQGHRIQSYQNTRLKKTGSFSSEGDRECVDKTHLGRCEQDG